MSSCTVYVVGVEIGTPWSNMVDSFLRHQIKESSSNTRQNKYASPLKHIKNAPCPYNDKWQIKQKNGFGVDLICV